MFLYNELLHNEYFNFLYNTHFKQKLRDAEESEDGAGSDGSQDAGTETGYAQVGE